MTRFFIIEVNDGFETAFVYEVTKTISQTIDYHRDPGPPVFNTFPGPHFYGKLDVLINQKQRIETATPIEPIAEGASRG